MVKAQLWLIGATVNIGYRDMIFRILYVAVIICLVSANGIFIAIFMMIVLFVFFVFVFVFLFILIIILIRFSECPFVIKPTTTQLAMAIKYGMMVEGDIYPCSPTMSLVNFSNSSSCATQPVRLSLYE